LWGHTLKHSYRRTLIFAGDLLEYSYKKTPISV
jgi:hypothetical protein